MGNSGAGNVHVGNVAEYNAPSLRSFEEPPPHRVQACDEYGSMAAFYTPDPGVVVVANADQSALDLWAEVQSDAMGWGSYRPLAWHGDSLLMSESLARLMPVADAIRRGATVVPWGETPEFRSLVEVTSANAVLSSEPDAASWLDSKASAVGLFDLAHRAIGAPDGLTVPQQWVADAESSLVPTLVDAGRRGRSVMIKSHVGVGGTGCQRVAAADIASPELAAKTLDFIRAQDPFVFTCPVLVQTCYDRSESDGDLTADLVVDANGEVRFLGAARMFVAGTHYEGCVTLEDDFRLGATIRSFAVAVGEIASDRGYRGWFDIDFVWSVEDGLVPLEVNARRTGPTVPMVIREVWGRRSTSEVHVAAHDLLPLDRPLTTVEAIDRYHEIVNDTGLEGLIVPTLVSAVSSTSPYLGVAVQGPSSAEAGARLDLFAKRLNVGGEG